MQMSFFDVPPVDVVLPQTAVVRTSNGNGHVIRPDLDPSTISGCDYRITGDDPIGFSGQMAKVRQNLEIIDLLKRLRDEKRQAMPEEQKQLVLYTGWGHTGQPFHPKAKGKWIDVQAEMRTHFTDEEWAAASFSTINAHYTSPEVIRWKWSVIERLGFKGGRILEPALGAGHYFGLMPAEIKAKSQLLGCELDLLSGAVAKQLYPSANIYVGGFEIAPYEAESFDLILSNVPFANLPVHDPSLYHNGRGHLSDIGLHNYYFVKALDLARPGGLIAFITSRFTMDALESKVRAYIAEQAHFLGAIRLPVLAFKKNAHTEVTTDVIFLLKKDERTIHGASWVDTVSKGDYRLNEYYDNHPLMMVGEMKLEGGRYEDAYECVVPKNYDLAAALNRILELEVLPPDLYKPAPPKPRRQMVVESLTFDNPPTDSWIRVGSYAQDDYYRIWQKTNPSRAEGPLVASSGQGWKRAELEGRQLSRVRGLIEVRDAFHRTIAANVNFVSEAHLIRAQQELGTVYRRFVAKWGFLHEPANVAAFGEDVDSDNILALERWDPFAGRAEKAAIFSERLLTPETRPEKADTPMDALIIALRETGQVDLPRMMELTGKTEAQLIEALQGRIFFDPAENLWVTADEYLSGNIRQKLAYVEQVDRIEGEEDITGVAPAKYEGNILALREVMPRDVGSKDIFVQLGAPWVPQDIIEEFIQRQLFDDPHHDLGRVKPVYLKTLGYWRLDTSEAYRLRQSAENRQTWGTNRVEGLDLIEKCLNGQQATIYDTWEDEAGREHKSVNQEATLVARAKQADIRTAFDKWIWANESRTDRLVTIYNTRFNSTLPRRFDGTPLHFPHMNPAIILRQIQKDVIWRGLQNQALMIAHSVGFGKTYSLTGLTMRLRQTRLRQRVCIVVKRATFGQFVASFRDTYPLSRISPIASGQSGSQRRRQLARITTEDYDVIITTHPVFYQIPLRPATKARFLHDQIAELEEAIMEARGDRISTKELEKAKKRLKNKLQRAMEKGAAHDENALYFEDLGLDALLVDECFPWHTRILTDQGWLPIGYVVDNKLSLQVLTCDLSTLRLEWKPIIRRLSHSLNKRLVRVTHEFGSFECTEDHKVWTQEEGYVKAICLQPNHHTLQTLRADVCSAASQPNPLQQEVPGKSLASLPGLQRSFQCILSKGKVLLLRVRAICLPEPLQGGHEDVRAVRPGVHLQINRAGKRSQTSVLYNNLLGCLENVTTWSQRTIQSVDRRRPAQSSLDRGTPSQGVSLCEGQSNCLDARNQRKAPQVAARKNFFKSGWQWGVNQTAKAISRAIGFIRLYGVCHQNRAGQRPVSFPASPLQSGYSQSLHQIGDRGGWLDTSAIALEIPGSSQDGSLGGSGVVSVEVLESGSAGRPGDLCCQSGTVYDLEIADRHNFFAEGVLVSNCTAYKNLWFHSIMSRISGVGGTESGRAYDMFLKIRWLQKRRAFVAFATGTPVENSISEVWVMMSYLMPERLRELGLHHFDAWASTFGKVVTGVEMKPDGSGFRMASRFASFNNLVQLKRLWWEVADTQMDGEKAGIVRPEIMTGKPIGIQAEAYPELKRIIETLANRANNLADVDPSVDNILKIMSDADKASLDARLLGKFPVVDQDGKKTGEVIHITEDYAGSKVNLCADQVAQIYHDTHAAELPGKPGLHRLTQLIFLDSSTPKSGQWTVYADLRQKLIDRGVKPAEIAFAQDYGDDDKKAKLAAALNAGKIRVAIGHTEIMGIGLNCQRLLVALHHLDCPWKPAWLEQRDGRIWRQGNLCPQISIYRYVMGGSFDVYRWQTVERKYSFIVAFNSEDLSVNTIEDPGMAVLSAREMTALATGNPAIIRQVELQTRLRILTAQKREYDDSLYSARGRLRRLQGELESQRRKLERYQALLAPATEQGIEAAVMLGQQLYDLCAPHFEVVGEKVEIGQLYNLKVLYLGTEVKEKPDAARPKVDRNYWGAADQTPLEGAEAGTEGKPEEPPPSPKIKVDKEIYLENDEWDFLVKFDLRGVEETRASLNANVLKKLYEEELPDKIREHAADVADVERNIGETEKMLAKRFEYADEMEQIEAELAGVEREIRDTLGEADASENRQAARMALEIGQEVEEILAELEPEEVE